MSNVIQFPAQSDRDWRVWEEEIRNSHKGTLFDDAVVEEALVAIKEHWKVIFENVTIQVDPVEIPGPITPVQLSAIEASGKAAGDALVKRIKLERCKALALLMNAEILLAYYRQHGVPPLAQ